jgi:hypothetical protein
MAFLISLLTIAAVFLAAFAGTQLALKGIADMNDQLKTAVDDLVAETQDANGKLESIKTYLHGVPDLVATAVETALANVNADESAAAEQIEAARSTISSSVDATLDAIQANDTTDTGSTSTDAGSGSTDTGGSASGGTDGQSVG